MTKEEAVIILDGFKNNPLFSDTHVQAFDMAISALSELGTKANEAIKPYVELAHSVSAENKGEWKRTYLDHVAMGERPSVLYCSVCCQCIAYPTNYCPNCGARMKGSEDRE